MKLLHHLLDTTTPGRARTLSVFVCVALLTGAWLNLAVATHAWAQPQSISFELPHLQTDPGDTVVAWVAVRDWLGVSGIKVAKFCVQFEPTLLEPTHVALGVVYAFQVAPGAFTVNLDEPGLACITINNPDRILLSDDVLVGMEFAVDPLAHNGESSLLEMVGSDGAEVVLLEEPDDPPPGIKAEVSEGSVTSMSGPTCMRADANLDGAVNSGDAIVILRIDTGLIADPSDEQLCSADANLDRLVNVADAIWVLRETVGLPHKHSTPVGRPRAHWVSGNEGLTLRVEDGAGLYGLALDLAYDPATTRLAPMPVATVGLRVEGEPISGQRRVRWASGTALPGAGEDLVMELAASARAAGAALSVVSLTGYDGLGHPVAIELEGEPTVWLTGSETGVPEAGNLVVSNYPNPFNPSTNIRFALPAAGRVRLDVFDATGKHVTSLLDETRPAGPSEVRWNGTDASGRPVSSGVYYARLAALRLTATQRLVLLK